MDLIGKIGVIAPGLAARYLASRAKYLRNQRLYEAAKASNYRPMRGSSRTPDQNMTQAGETLRNLARYLEENHDLVVGVLDDLVNNVVGAGVAVEPMVRTRAGELDEDVNDQIREWWDEWKQSPEVTGELGFEQVERAVARGTFRDGEILLQDVNIKSFRYRTPINYVVELIEPDYLPFTLTDPARGITHGVERNAWGAPIAYHMVKRLPGPHEGNALSILSETRRVSSARIRHLKFSRRIGQARGVTVLHSVINRLRDVSDYEESERIAAKVASNIALAVERNSEFTGEIAADKSQQIEMAAGAVFDLMPGEEIKVIGSDRPNTGLQDFRNAMMRAVAAGTGSRYSSISRDYNGSYSAQRQELVEGSIAYRALFTYFRAKFYRPTWQRFIDDIFLSGKLQVAPQTDLDSIYRAEWRPPVLPWIDPSKESKAYETLIKNQLESRAEVARKSGRDPRKVREEIEAEKNSGLYDAPAPAPIGLDELDDVIDGRAISERFYLAPAEPDQDDDDQNNQDDDADRGEVLGEWNNGKIRSA